MLAVTVKRTTIHYGQVHFCRKQGTVVKKDHIDECGVINLDKKITHFNEALQSTYLYDLGKN